MIIEKLKKLVPLSVGKDENLIVIINRNLEPALDAKLASFWPHIIKYGASEKDLSIKKIIEDKERALSEIAPQNANAYLIGSLFIVRDIIEREKIFTIEAVNYFHINEEQAKIYLNSLG